MRVAVVCDMGREPYHVGDEAIASATVHQLVSRGHQPILFSHGPAQTSEDFPEHHVVPAVGVPFEAAGQSALLGAARRPRSLWSSAEAAALGPAAEALSSTDALLIAGGGNLISLWGALLLYERLVMVELAAAGGLPVVVSGQTFGPVFSSRDAREVTTTLSRCTAIGVRDRRSADLAADLVAARVPIWLGLDAVATTGRVAASADTGRSARSPGRPEAPGPSGPIVIAATLPFEGELGTPLDPRCLAAELDTAAERTNATVVLVPQVGRPGTRDGDVAAHDRIVAASTSGRLSSLPVDRVPAALALPADTSIVVTTRFHPAVFAYAAGRPALALALDDYGQCRMDGAAQAWGLAGRTVSAWCLRPGELGELIVECLAERAAVGAHLQARRPALVAFEAAWWDAIDTALRGVPMPPPQLPAADAMAPPQAVARLHAASAQLSQLTARSLACAVEAEQLRQFAGLADGNLDRPPAAAAAADGASATTTPRSATMGSLLRGAVSRWSGRRR